MTDSESSSITVSTNEKLLSDLPINEPSQDRLERVPFARTLALSLRDMQGDDSFVISLQGPWGSGKTSFLNLVLYCLAQQEPASQAIIFHFNPWWFSGQNQLMQMFLSQFGAAIGRKDSSKGIKRISKLMSVLADTTRPLSYIPIASRWASEFRRLFAAIAKGSKSLADHMKKDIYGIKAEIGRLLLEQNRRIVVVVDDLDRLSTREVADMFMIIKGVADFPKTTFLLAFDHSVIAKALSAELNVDGNDYLAKIVQMPLEIPYPGPLHLQHLFLEEMRAISDVTLSGEESVNFGNVFYGGIAHFLDSPRNVKRLTNAVRVLHAGLRGEIYFPDLIGITCLMVFCPDTHQLIRGNKEMFTGHPLSSQHFDNVLKPFHEKWLTSVDPAQRKAVEDTLKYLFPLFGHARGGASDSTSFEVKWQADLRICSVTHFDTYFHFSLPAGAISEDEWLTILSLLSTGSQFDEAVLNICRQRGRLGGETKASEFLEKAHAFLEKKATPEQARQLLNALLRVGDEVTRNEDRRRGGFVPTDNQMRLHWAINSAIQKCGNSIERGQSAIEGLRQSTALEAALEFIEMTGWELGRYTREKLVYNNPILSESCHDTLLSEIRKKLDEAAATGQLFEHHAFMRIIAAVKIIGFSENATKWVHQLAQTDKGLVKIIKGASSPIRSFSAAGRFVPSTLHVSVEWLADYFDLNDLRERCAKILSQAPEWLSEDERQTLELATSRIRSDGSIVPDRVSRIVENVEVASNSAKFAAEKEDSKRDSERQ